MFRRDGRWVLPRVRGAEEGPPLILRALPGQPRLQELPCPWGPRVEGLCPRFDASLCTPFFIAHSARLPPEAILCTRPGAKPWASGSVWLCLRQGLASWACTAFSKLLELRG